jgi:DNA mismatch endonuclease (patch repair protein)
MLAVFVDGEFWHGKDFDSLAAQLKTRRDFWLTKIQANMERDRRNDRALAGMGYEVLRFWGREILRDPDEVAEAIARRLR